MLPPALFPLFFSLFLPHVFGQIHGNNEASDRSSYASGIFHAGGGPAKKGSEDAAG